MSLKSRETYMSLLKLWYIVQIKNLSLSILHLSSANLNIVKYSMLILI